MALDQTRLSSTQPGWFQINGMRTVLLDVQHGVHNLRRILYAGLGEAEVDMMFDIGQWMGRVIARNVLSRHDAQPDEKTFRAAVDAYTRVGVGNLRVEELAWEKGWAVVTCPDTFEGWAYAQNDDVQPESKCDYSRGVLVSLMSEIHRAAGADPDKLDIKDIHCVETICLGRGDSECRFVIGISADLEAAGLTIPQPKPTVQSQLEEMLSMAQRRAVLLEVGREVALRLMAALDPDELMAQVVQLVKDYFGYYHVNVYQLDPETDFLNTVEGTDEVGRIMKESGYRIAVGQGLVGQVAQTGRPMLVADVSQELQWLPNSLLPETRSELAVPLRLGDEILGVLDVQSKQVDGVAKEDVSLLEGLGGQIAVAIQNARLFELERRRRLEATTLQKVSRSLNLSLDLDEILGIILEQLQKVVSFDSAAVLLRDENVLRPVVGIGFSDKKTGIHRDFTAGISMECDLLLYEIVREKKPLVLFDARQDERFRPTKEMASVRGWIGAPLIVQDRVLGVLTVSSRQPGAYDKEITQTVLAFASQAATALQNATLFAELEIHRAKLEDQVAERTRELREFRAFAETAPDAILLSDLAETIQYANPAFYTLFGYSAASNEALGLPVSQLIRKDEWAEIVEKIKGALEMTGSHRGDMVLVRRDGSTFPAGVITFLVRDDEGMPAARARIIRDLTDERRIQQERALLREDLITTQERLIEELSTPIIPVTDDILVVPLIGSIDNPRAQRIIEALLKGIEDYQTRIVILDITGVPQVDSDVANYLMQAALSARLLGTEAVLVGITPQVARAFVDLDVDLTGIVTRSNLQGGIEYALGRMGLHITKKLSKMESLRRMLEAQVGARSRQPQPEDKCLME